MLSCLQIENVAVIQKAEVHFQPGLNVLTGETGAGKSILIDSINAILGNRTSKDLVRTGASKAVIRASFAQIPDVVLDKLEAAGYERSAELLLSREITAEGKSSCRINGMPTTAAVLRELCGGLININGQHDSVGLLNPAHHLSILDDYAQNAKLYQEYYVLYRSLVKVKKELDAMITQLLNYKDTICRRMEVMSASRQQDAQKPAPAATAKPGTPAPKPPKIMTVRRYDLCSVKRLQNKEDIDKYVEAIREKLVKTLESCDGVQIN